LRGGIVGYISPLSIEHEDSLMSSKERLEKAIDMLESVTFETTTDEVYWT